MIQIGHKTRRASNMPHDISILTLPLPLRMGRVNCYLIRTAAGHLLIDTGGSNARKELLRELENVGCMPGSLKLAILTHGDFDLSRTRPASAMHDADMSPTRTRSADMSTFFDFRDRSLKHVRVVPIS